MKPRRERCSAWPRLAHGFFLLLALGCAGSRPAPLRTEDRRCRERAALQEEAALQRGNAVWGAPCVEREQCKPGLLCSQGRCDSPPEKCDNGCRQGQCVTYTPK